MLHLRIIHLEICYACCVAKRRGEAKMLLLFCLLLENENGIRKLRENCENCGNEVADRRSMSWMHFDRHRYRISY